MGASDLRSELFATCKALRERVARERLRTLIRGLNTSSGMGQDGAGAGGGFGYAARQQRAQVFGYLLVDQECRRLGAAQPLRELSPLRADERSVLSAAHAEFAELDSACVSSLEKAIPGVSAAVNPYSGLIALARGVQPSDDRLFPSDAIKSIAAAFGRLPPLAVAVSTASSFPNPIPVEECERAVLVFDRDINTRGVWESPPDLEAFFHREPPDSPRRAIYVHLLALLCTRECLRVVNQILFQAILVDKLGALNGDSIVSHKKHGSNLIGQGVTVEYVPSAGIGFAEPGDVLVLDQQPPALAMHALCVVEQLRMEMSPEVGWVNEVTLRVLNESLCPYSGLFSLVARFGDL